MGNELRKTLGLLSLIVAALATAWLLAAPAQAGPASPDVFELRQPGGDAFAARQFGDEWANGVETKPGHTILQGTRGRWHYAEKERDGSLGLSGEIVGRDLPTMRKHLRDVPSEQRGARRQERATSAPDGVELAPGIGGPSQSPSVGADKTLIILATFNDQASLGSTPAQWNDRFFGGGKSVTDYFEAASGGAFSLSPATESHGTVNDGVVGWINVGVNHPNSATATETDRAAARAAILAANPHVNYAAYDTNGDGTVRNTELHVFVVAAGQERSCCAAWGGKSLWAHRWTVSSPPVVDGKYVGGWGYTLIGEMHGDHLATIGIMVHEFGHDLDLPDLYDSDRPGPSTSEGVGAWSVMGFGSWLRVATDPYQGMTPGLPDAWSRWFKGWITPRAITGAQTADVRAASSGVSDVAVQLLDNPGGPHDWSWQGTGVGEYFLVENRQRTPGTYDEGLPGSGLLVLHIIESQGNNATDTMRLVDVEEADNYGLDAMADRGTASDLYRSGGVTSFTAATAPNSNLNNGTASGVAMTGVGASGATMRATFTAPGGTTTAPANDLLAAATTVTAPAYDGAVTTTHATIETGERSQQSCPIGRTVWYRFSPDRDVRVRADTSGSGFDTVLNVWSGGPGIAQLTAVSCNDDVGGGVRTSAVPEFVARAGQTYWLQVGGYYDATAQTVDAGALQLHVRTRPLNDDLAAATEISGTSGQSDATNVGATKEQGEPLHADNAGGASVWWTWTAPEAGTYTVDTLGSAAALDTLLGVYTGDTIAGLTPVAANDDADRAGGVYRSRVSFAASAGTTYRFAVDSYRNTQSGQLSSTGALRLTWAKDATSEPEAPGTPSGVTALAGDGSAAVSWGAAAANGSPVTGYTVTSNPGGLTRTVAGNQTSTTVTGLTNGTAYTFTVRASNAIGDGPASAPSAPVTPTGTVVEDDDLALALSRVDDAGTTTTFRAAVTRDGPARSTTVLWTMPDSVLVLDAPGCVGETTLTCATGSIADGGSRQVEVTVRPLTPGPHRVEAVLTTADDASGNDEDFLDVSVADVCDNLPTTRDDVVTGTVRDDVLCGLDGDDIIEGGPGDDLILAGPGADVLSYAGSDGGMVVNLSFQALTAEAAWEATEGTGDGADLVSGVEHVEGSPFADHLLGERGGNRIWGLGGRDRVLGLGGRDSLNGGSGGDRLWGQGGKDRLVGGRGRDRLDGGGGRDSCADRRDQRVRCEG